MLNFSRTSATEVADLDVNRVVEETLSLVAHPLKTSQIQVVKQLGETLPAVRGSALVSVQQLSKDSPGLVNSMRPLLHTMASTDGNQAVRRLAIVCLRNGSPQRETIVLLGGLAEDDEQEPDLRKTARTVAAELRKRAGPKG